MCSVQWQSSSVQSVRRCAEGERAVRDWLWSEVELGFAFSPPWEKWEPGFVLLPPSPASWPCNPAGSRLFSQRGGRGERERLAEEVIVGICK